jgi:RNA polymerase sigma factor (sigma-70 family)
VDNRARQEWVATQVLPHEKEVRAWLRRRVYRLTRPDIDDLIQEAYGRLWTADLPKIGNARSYLFTVVRNLLIEQARHARIIPMERLGEIDALRIPSEEPGPDRRVGGQLELERLERVVTALPVQCRRAFTLKKFQGLSQREIAHEMKISEKTVEKHLASALERVLSAMSDEGGSPSAPFESGISAHDAQYNQD